MKYLLLSISLLALSACQSPRQVSFYDVVVYGGTSAGVMAAYTAKMSGRSVLLIEPGRHLGGLSSSGLGETDIGNKYTVTGLSRDFYRRLGKHYGSFEAWRFEPHVAEATFNEYIAEAKVEVLFAHRIIDLQKEGTRIQSITLENSEKPEVATQRNISGGIFIDASYEGDVLGRAGISYTIGREGNEMYHETLNGVQHANSNQIPDGIDPYIIPGDSSSGLLWGIKPDKVAAQGTGDRKVQAYNYRLCLSSDSTNRLPFSPPAGYDASRYEILRRIIQQRADAGWTQRIHQLYLRVSPMPNQKTDINNKGGFSTDLIGGSWEYPEASYARRKEIEAEHRHYIEGLLYFLAHDPAVPKHVQEQMQAYGWAKDEFTDNDGFPHQIYVREARRLVGDFVMTEHHCRGDERVHDAIAMGAYNMDSHHGDRHVINGMVKNEGEVQEAVPPYGISYRAMLPKAAECENLLVAACISSSHIAYGSIRMEPVFMMLGQAAGVAADMALDKEISVQTVDGVAVKEALARNPLMDGSQPEILMNNEDKMTETTGDWTVSAKKYTDFYLHNFLVTNGPSTGKRELTFQAEVPHAGTYKLYFYLTGQGRKDIRPRSSSVPLRLKHAGGQAQLQLDMRKPLESWVNLGAFDIPKGRLTLTVDASATIDEVIADAIILKPVTPTTTEP